MDELKITAAEARTIAAQAIQSVSEKELKNIFKLIREAAKAGEYCIYCNEFFLDETNRYLIELGYKVERYSGDYGNTCETKISWRE